MRKTSVIGAAFIVIAVVAAGSLWPNSNLPGEKVDYIGSEKCLNCHRDLHPAVVEKWQASAHRQAMRDVSGKEEIKQKNGLGTASKNQQFLALIGREDGQHVFIATNFEVLLPEDVQLKVSFTPHDRIATQGKALNAAQSCLGCHTTGYSVSRKEYIEPGVACEACHGPGKRHVESEGSAGTILNPAKLTPERNRMVCGQCHSQGKDLSGSHPFPVMKTGEPYQPGHDLASVFVDDKPIVNTKGGEYSTFIQSPEPYSRQLCTDCHDPHGGSGNPEMLVDSTSKLCLRCHGNILSGVVQVDEKSHWGSHRHTCWFCHEYTHLH